jgi:Ca2+-binding EF-hand superfamily protein|eukprot:COSAG02_NODE_2344_length_9101_cov_11.972117_8_plen_58_part_00
MQKKQAEEDMLREAFAALDEDGSGTLDKDEVRARDRAVPLAAAQRRRDTRAPVLARR